MLIELWERFRGYDRWIPAEATIESSQMEDHEFTYRGTTGHRYESSDTLVWTDNQGNRQTALCSMSDDSPLYQLIGGEKIAIRYNPANPEEYFFPELLKSRVHTYFVGIVAAVLFVGLIVVPPFLFVHVFGK